MGFVANNVCRLFFNEIAIMAVTVFCILARFARTFNKQNNARLIVESVISLLEPFIDGRLIRCVSVSEMLIEPLQRLAVMVEQKNNTQIDLYTPFT